MSATLRQRNTQQQQQSSARAPGSAQRDLHHQHHHEHHHGHSHSHGPDEAAALVSALAGKGSDPGSRITLIGLGANVALTGVKGAAGWVLGSAALLADAAHSGSDLLADVVTLTTYRMSRKPVSLTHPYGYGSQSRLVSIPSTGCLT